VFFLKDRLLSITIVLFVTGFFWSQVCFSAEQIKSSDVDISKGEETMEANIRLELSNKGQIWRGFGVSGAWWAQSIGECDEPTRKKILSLLFDREAGMGIQIYRYNIGAGEPHSIKDPWRSTETFEISKGVYDWTRDSAAMKVLKESVDLGVEKVIAFANSPTGRMTVSGGVDGHRKGQSNFNMAFLDDFCDYLLDVSDFLVSQGIPITEISPINEPQWDWNPSKGQEGCHYSPEEATAVVKRLLERIEDRGQDYRVDAVDSGDWRRSRKYMDELFSNPWIAERLESFHIHSYWSDALDKKRIKGYFDLKYPGVAIEMSEWTQMNTGRETTMESALDMARVIFEDITIGHVTSWQYWIAVSKYDFTDGLLYVDFDSENDKSPEITLTKRIFAMGNYSKFIRSGQEKISVSGEYAYLKPVAFYDLEFDEIVVVIINDSPFDFHTHVNVCDETGYFIDEVHLTDAANNLRQLELIEWSGQEKQTNVTIPHQSVITLLLKKTFKGDVNQ